jgi:hypothetical protein
LKSPDADLEDRLDNIKRAQKRIERKIEIATNILADEFDEITESGIENMQNIVFEAKDDCMRIVGSARRNEVGTKLNTRIDRLNQIDLPKAQKAYKKSFIKALNNKCEDFANEVEEQLERYIDDCDDIKEVFRLAIGKGANSIKNSAEDTDFDLFGSNFENKTIGMLSRILVPVWIARAISDWKGDVYNNVQSHFRQYDFKPLKEATLERRPAYLKLLKTEATSKLLGELVDKLSEALESKEKREKLINETESSLANNKRCLSELESQISELKAIIN